MIRTLWAYRNIPLRGTEITHPLTHPHTPLLTSACGQPKVILRFENKDWSYIDKDSDSVTKDWKWKCKDWEIPWNSVPKIALKLIKIQILIPKFQS